MMNKPAVRYISRAGLDAIAWKTLNNYDPSFFNGEPQATPIEEIIENNFGLKIQYISLRKFGKVLGKTVFTDSYVDVYCRDEKQYGLIWAKSGTILVEERLLECENEGRLRFTLAHEFSHWILHKSIYEKLVDTAAHTGELQIEDNSSLEWQADYLASALLMPKMKVKSAFYKLRNKASDITAELAELFDVSKQAMSIFYKRT
jgi:hypothetical protein